MHDFSYDAVVVGAGFSGSVVSERLASAGKRVLVIEQRAHVGGNCYEQHDWQTGILVHKYGPHIFHTDNAEVWDYLSRFTEWRPYSHKVEAEVEGKLVPLPFSFKTIREVFPPSKADSLIQCLQQEYPDASRVPILELRKSSRPEIQDLAEFIYQNVFLHYSAKQWGKRPEDLSPEVTGRVPILLSEDDQYFNDPWQYMPRQGMNPVFDRMLSHPNIHVLLQTPYGEVLRLGEDLSFSLYGNLFSGPVFFTALLDELFQFRFGELPYRSLRFEISEPQHEGLPVAVVNFPNRPEFTRITDCRILSGQNHLPETLLMKEFPQAYQRGDAIQGIPYYPIFTPECQAVYAQYSELARSIPNLIPLGRLAEYRYYDMDDAIARALNAVKPWLA